MSSGHSLGGLQFFESLGARQKRGLLKKNWKEHTTVDGSEIWLITWDVYRKNIVK